MSWTSGPIGCARGSTRSEALKLPGSTCAWIPGVRRGVSPAKPSPVRKPWPAPVRCPLVVQAGRLERLRRRPFECRSDGVFVLHPLAGNFNGSRLRRAAVSTTRSRARRNRRRQGDEARRGLAALAAGVHAPARLSRALSCRSSAPRDRVMASAALRRAPKGRFAAARGPSMRNGLKREQPAVAGCSARWCRAAQSIARPS
jgi:hypothetical protein